MSTSGRISLQDCTVELIIPSLFSFSSPTHDESTREPTLEDLTLQAAEAAAREITEAYVGETIFLVVTITGPDSVNYTCETLFQALEAFGDVNIFMGHIPNQDSSSAGTPLSRSRQKALTAHSCSLPILRESTWIGSDRSSASIAQSRTTSPKMLCKGLWALVRTPPQASEMAEIVSMASKQDIFVSLRERSVSHSLRNSPVWASIDRASRLFGKSIALGASKPLMVNVPLDISSHHIVAGGSTGKAFVNITVRNSTSDAHLLVVPPYIHVGASKIVDDPSVRRRKSSSESNVASQKEKAAPAAHEQVLSLDQSYEFTPLFDLNNDDDSELVTVGDESPRKFSRESRSDIAPSNDYGLFIPSFNNRLKKAVPLGPREIFNFVYAIVEKGNSSINNIENAVAGLEVASLEKGIVSPKGSDENKPASEPSVRLEAGKCLETCIAVAWNCTPRDVSEAAKDILEVHEPLQRQMSSGGVLATGKRGNVAVHTSSVHWAPPKLIVGVIMNFAGPSSAQMGCQIMVSISILNQSKEDLNTASLLVQQEDVGSGGHNGLLALRTVISIGRLVVGSGTTLQLPCIALKAGIVSLGKVTVVDENTDGRDKLCTSDSSFEVFVVDPNLKVAGDPIPQSSTLGTVS